MPFGPDISWPTGYSDLEYRNGDYRYPAPSAPNHGEDPYAAFSPSGYGAGASGQPRRSAADFGYGDPGYSNPGYNGPASQDAGIPGTRTVRGYVETGPAPQRGYAPSGYAEPGYPLAAPTGPAPARPEYGRPGYTGRGHSESSRIELAYPLPRTDQQQGYGAVRHAAPAYDPADYNGSPYSRPGIDGPGYDLSGIIGTGDFAALGYDEPGYDRLAYDDPRYDGRRYGASAADARRDGRSAPGAPGPRFDETRFDVPRFDETRLDSLWLAREDIRRDEPAGYGNDGFGAAGRDRSGYPVRGTGGGADFAAQRRRFDDTRYDLRVSDLGMDHTRFDVPVFDETRIDNLRPAATGLLAPADDPWSEFDEYGDLDLDDPADVPAAFTRTAERRGDDTGTRRAVGRRRGRSGDRRQWMALGAIAVVAAGAIGGVLMKYVFSGPSGPAHTIVAPDQVDGFTRMPNLEKQMKVAALRDEVMSSSAGQASDVVSAVYQQGSSALGGDPQIFMFVGGKLSSAAPATSIANFTQTYPGATVVPAGSLGGEAACAEASSGGEGVAMCVWFDNDSFGELVSPTMTTAKLATTLDAVRPSLELYANSAIKPKRRPGAAGAVCGAAVSRPARRYRRTRRFPAAPARPGAQPGGGGSTAA